MVSTVHARSGPQLLSAAAARAILLASLAVVTTNAQTRATQPPCIGVVLPSVRGADSSADAMAGAIRDVLISFLTGPGLRSMPLDARLHAQAAQEAQQKSCDRLLTLTATRKRGGGAFGRAISTAATTAAWQVPLGRTASAVGARSAALGGAYAVAELAQNTKAKDEVTLEYQLESAGRAQVASAKVSAKAKADGEDLLTPLAELVATAVAAAVSASRP